MTTSLQNRRRNARARRTAEIAASGSSALTWMIGASKPFARSLEYRVDRPSSGSVVNPTWLFEIRWSVQSLARRAVRLVGARPPLDDGIDRFEVARVRGERDVDLAARRHAPAVGAE